MKPKSKKAHYEKKKEIRFHSVSKNKKRHPAYIFLKKGNIYIYVSLTHSPKVEKLILVKLRKNPNQNDHENAYWIAEIKTGTKDEFGRIQKNWKVDELDDLDIRLFFYKNKR